MALQWTLPEGIEDVLPPVAGQLETLRRTLLDTCIAWGYQLVETPVVEHLSTLLANVDEDLNSRTCKLTDPMTGELLGIRSDFAPQLVRIDTHVMRRGVPVRLCYCGTLLQARPDSQGGARAPLRIGAELFGSSLLNADIEVARLMQSVLLRAGLSEATLVLGHVGIFNALTESAGLDAVTKDRLFRLVQRKDSAGIAELGVEEPLSLLPSLYGSYDQFAAVCERLGEVPAAVQQALDEVDALARALADMPLSIVFDLGELHGCAYHTGVVFAAYATGCGQCLARGGRYDSMSGHFGGQRPATGFDLDLAALLRLIDPPASDRVLYAPDGISTSEVQRLRESGETVVAGLPNDGGARALGCTGELVAVGDSWEPRVLSPTGDYG